MSALTDVRAWFDLQGETLDRLHASWLPGLAPELIPAARSHRIGRRWLSNCLATISPYLFGLPQESGSVGVAGLRGSDWFVQRLRDPLECALDLGSVALASTVRTLVAREAVVKLRAALGAARYERVLTASIPDLPFAAAKPADSNEEECDIVERLLRRGVSELLAFANHLHRALGESVILTFDRNWWPGAPQPGLPPAVAEAALRPGLSAPRPEPAPEGSLESVSEAGSAGTGEGAAAGARASAEPGTGATAAVATGSGVAASTGGAAYQRGDAK